MAKTTKTAAKTTARGGRRTVGGMIADTFDNAVRIARTVTVTTFDAIIGGTGANGTAHASPVTHAARNVCRFTGRRVMAVQNDTLRRNVSWQLDDVQLLALWRMCFPSASGRVFAAPLRDAVGIVNGVRAHYNRDGHGDPAGKPATESVRYGTKPAFTPVASAVTTASAKPAARTRKPVAPGVPGGRLVKRPFAA